MAETLRNVGGTSGAESENPGLFCGCSAPEVPPTLRRISAIFLKLLPIVDGGTRLRVALSG